MTLHTEELTEIGSIGRREAETDSKKYGICHFAFDICEDSRDPGIFYRFCDRAGNRCPLCKERIEKDNLS